MIKKTLFIFSSVIFSIATILLIYNIFLSSVDDNGIITEELDYQVYPFLSWKKNDNINNNKYQSQLLKEEIDKFIFMNETHISIYVLLEDDIKHVDEIFIDDFFDINDYYTSSTVIIYEYIIKNKDQNNAIIYNYNVINEDKTYSIDMWNTYCNFFVDNRTNCQLGNISENEKSIGLITLTDNSIISIIEPRNQILPFINSAGVYETYGNSLGVYSHYLPIKKFEVDDDDIFDKFTYNFKEYLDELFDYPFVTLNDFIHNHPPYISYKDWPEVIFIDFTLRKDLSKYKNIIIDSLKKENINIDKLVTFTLADLTRITLERCPKFKTSIETCKTITRLWFYLYIIERIPQNIPITILEKNIDIRTSKILSMTRNRLM